jgi:YfiH family protein
LSVTVADCLPVYLYDTASGAFALVHSGWKGTGIVLRALELMAELGRSKPEAVAAVLGPCISVCCYKVDPERAAAFEKEFGGNFSGLEVAAGKEATGLEAAAAAYLGPVSRREETKGGPAWYLDLKAANVRLLAGAGVRNIAVCEDCTFTDARLGSFRREGPQNGSYTRMLALAGYF